VEKCLHWIVKFDRLWSNWYCCNCQQTFQPEPSKSIIFTKDSLPRGVCSAGVCFCEGGGMVAGLELETTLDVYQGCGY